MTNQQHEHQPQVVSRQIFTEGGYTFLERALKTALQNEEQTVIVSTGKLMITYRPDIPGQPEQTFMDGVRAVEGDDPETLTVFQRIAGEYLVQKGLDELVQRGNRDPLLPTSNG